MPEENMNRRGRIDQRRNSVRPEFDQLDARLLLSVTAAGGSASKAFISGSADNLTTGTGGAALQAPLAPTLSISLDGHSHAATASGVITLSATPNSATSINLMWTRLLTASEYVVDEWIDGSWKEIEKSSSASSGYTVGGLNPGTTYSFEVAAVCSSPAATIWSSARSATTLGSPPALPLMPSLTAPVISATEVSLVWSGGSGAQGFVVESGTSGNWNSVASLTRSSTNYTVTGLSPNTGYTFLVGAYNGAGTTWSNKQNATTYQQTTIKTNIVWSGYSMVPGSLVTGVGATWVQPIVTNAGANSRTGFWVGMDGFGNNTVEQLGTAWNPSTGYWAWIEFYGDGIQNAQGQWTAKGPYFNPVSINSLIGSNYFTIQPGDVISASVAYVSSTSANSTFEFRFQDALPGGPTKSWHGDLTTQYIVPTRTTADWIVEAPGGGVDPLAEFSPVNFSGAWVSTGGPPQPITAFPNVQLNLVPAIAGGTDFTSALTTSNTAGAWQFTGQSSAFNVVFGSANDSAQLPPSPGDTNAASDEIPMSNAGTIDAAPGSSTHTAQAIEGLVAMLTGSASLRRPTNWARMSVRYGSP
jgi:hypothetical protein